MSVTFRIYPQLPPPGAYSFTAAYWQERQEALLALAEKVREAGQAYAKAAEDEAVEDGYAPNPTVWRDAFDALTAARRAFHHAVNDLRHAIETRQIPKYVSPPTYIQPCAAEKIEVAKQARELGRQIREGKPKSFGPGVSWPS